MEDVMNAYGVFYLFSAACFGSWVWMWYYVPETRNKSLEEIETALKTGKA
jgi:major inositol transporter-like SP family MFS transporter